MNTIQVEEMDDTKQRNALQNQMIVNKAELVSHGTGSILVIGGFQQFKSAIDNKTGESVPRQF